MNRDRVFGATTPDTLRQSAFRVIDRTQDHPEVQLQATGIALFCMCKATGQDIRELRVACERMSTALDGPYTSTFRAIEEYSRDMIGSRR